MIQYFLFDNMVADMLNNKKSLNYSTVTELFMRGRKLNIYFLFITQSHFVVLNSVHYFIMKSPNKLHSIIYQILTFRNL